MFRHVVLFRWVDGTTDEQRRAVEAELAALPAQIPALREYRFGHDAGVVEGNADFAIIADFDDADGFFAYRDHPAHQDVAARITRPLTRERTTVQFYL